MADVPDSRGSKGRTRTSPSTDLQNSPPNPAYSPFNERQARPLVWIPPPPHSPASQPASSSSYFSYPNSGALGYPPLPGSRVASGSGVDVSSMPFGSFSSTHSYLPTTVPGQAGPNSSFEDWSGLGEFEVDEDGDSDDSTEAGQAMPQRSTSTESGDRKPRSLDAQPSPLVAKKKPRVTLARGGACVACRTRKLKCTGEKPCRSCRKAKVECRYEEIPRKKPRAVLLEERVVELEMLLLSKGETVPPSALTGSAFHYQNTGPTSGQRFSPGPSSTSTASRRTSNPTPPTPATAQTVGNQPAPGGGPSNFFDEFMRQGALNTGIDIPPHSPLETALINTVLPFAPHLFIPVHPQRFQALLTLPLSDIRRPHPALLYVMFAEAVRILERETPLPRLPPHPSHLFSPSFGAPVTQSAMDAKYALQHVRGMSLPLLERARAELDIGIRSVDRPFDLLRAAIIISRYLYTIGRFVEGWCIPIARLCISCGLHRSTGNYYPPDDKPAMDYLPPLSAPAEAYKTTYGLLMGTPALPSIRMRPVIIAPARDEIEVAERNLTFWFAKALDWEAGIGWGWTTALNDDECVTEWPWGWGTPEHRPQHLSAFRWGVRDLHMPGSPMHSSPFADSTFTLAIKSIGLLHRAQYLHDVPESAIPAQTPDGRFVPSHIPPLGIVQNLRSALQTFRKRIPAPFLYDASNPDGPEYDKLSDPWWMMLHFNLFTAEMLMWKEMSHHHTGSYETAVGCARAVVGMVKRLRPESWIHLDMVVALDLSMAARFLYKESVRLADHGQSQAAAMASEEADVLKLALVRDFTPWLPMANLHAMIVERVQAGWTEKEGEYERM